MINPSNIDTYPLQLVKTLQGGGFKTYFVGGCVRDLMLGRRPKDFDIATSARPHEIRKLIHRGRLIGKRFKLVLVRHEGHQFEISTFRSAKERLDHRGRPDFNIFGTPEDDAKRRDFTINALFYDPVADKVLDYVQGQEDLHRRTLRAIRDPKITYTEDPIRILRGLRIAGKLGLDINPEDYHVMVTRRNFLAEASRDRIREEVFKALKEGTTLTFWKWMIRSGAAEHVLPVLSEYSKSQIDDLMSHLAQYDKSLPFRDFEIGIAVTFLPLARRLFKGPSHQISSPQEINTELNFSQHLKLTLRYSNQLSESVAKIFFFWFQIKDRWIDEGVPETQKHRLQSDPHFVAALQLVKLEEHLLGDETPSMRWVDQTLAACSPSVGSVREMPLRVRRGPQRPGRGPGFRPRGRPRKFTRSRFRRPQQG